MFRDRMESSLPLRRAAVLSLLLAAANPAFATGVGPDPDLPPPDPQWIPKVQVAEAVGWKEGQAPVPAPGFSVSAFATGLDHPRWLLVLPNGDVLVAETNAPQRPAQGGLRGWFMSLFMKRAGAATPSADRITLLRDVDGDGSAEQRHVLLEQLHSPFGMALVGDVLYVANTDAVLAFDYARGATRLQGPGRRIAALPGGPRNHHWTKSLVASADGRTLYAGVGSNSNIAENGLAEETDRAAILAIDIASGRSRVFASGLRNPVGLAWQPDSGELWTSVNERDELGDDLVPDYMTSVRDGDFFGWPWSYFGQHVDARVEPPNPERVAAARKPDYALGAHTASLGLAFYDGALLPARYRGGAFVGQHGSWNRRPPAGYQVVFVPFSAGKPAGKMEPVLTGFLVDGEARGRPVGVAVAGDGAVLVADDVGNVVWRLVPR